MANKRNATRAVPGGASADVQRASEHHEVTKTSDQPQAGRRIIQITAAPAFYKLVFKTGDGQQMIRPSALALVEDERGNRTVHFLDENGRIADDDPCFSDVIDFGSV